MVVLYIICQLGNLTLKLTQPLLYFRLSGSGKDGQFGRARYTKSPELIETTFSMSTIEEEQEIALSLKSVEG